MGPTEAIIILIIVLVLFGPTLVAFFLGYSLGKKRAPQPASSPSRTDGTQGAEAAGVTDNQSGADAPGEEHDE